MRPDPAAGLLLEGSPACSPCELQLLRRIGRDVRVSRFNGLGKWSLLVRHEGGHCREIKTQNNITKEVFCVCHVVLVRR